MAQSGSRARVVGDYVVGRQIGSGSFSVVWHARHRVHGMEVAIKEIVMERLSKKLQESLMSEIVILKKINHPNIIRLHDIIQVGPNSTNGNKAYEFEWEQCNSKSNRRMRSFGGSNSDFGGCK